MWLAIALIAIAQEPTDDVDTDADSDAVPDASQCGLRVTREVPPDIRTALPAGSPGCRLQMTVDERGRVSDVQALECPDDVIEEIRPTFDKWRFERTDCPVDDPLSFITTFETESQTWLIPQESPVDMSLFNAPEGTEGCLMALTLLPDGSIENTRANAPECTVALGGSGWNPERFWRDEIEGLRCQATFEAREGQVNRVQFSGCGGPSRLALVSFIERASWAAASDEPVSFDVRFRMRDDDSEPLERASQEARYIRQACEDADAPGFLARKTRIPAMPARWALDQSTLAAYCRLRVHLDEQAVPRRIDAVLCNGVYGPRAASAAAEWTYRAPTCGDQPAASEVVVVVPFARRITGGGLQNVFGRDADVVDLVGSMTSRRTELDHCEMWVDVPSDGRIRIITSDVDNCYVTPNSVPAIPRRKLLKWAELTDEWNIYCNSNFTARTTSVDEPTLGTCYLGTRELAKEAIADWSWSVLGREEQEYTVHWRFRLD